VKTGIKKSVKAPATENTRVNLRLSVEASRRLWVTAVMSDRTASAIVESLILDGLKRFSMPSDLSKRHLHQSSPLPSPLESPAEIAA
jgi:hypothetical protein